MLLLLHDKPVFLCEYHLALCDVIPPACVQLRNLVLSAFPPKMKLPDPFAPGLKVEEIADIKASPRIRSDYQRKLDAVGGLRAKLDACLSSRRPQNAIRDLMRTGLTPDVLVCRFEHPGVHSADGAPR